MTIDNDTTPTNTDAAPAAAPETPVEQTPEDVFANAFAEFAASREKPAEDETVTPPVAVEPEPVEAEAAPEETPEEPPEPEQKPQPQPESQRQPTPEEIQAYYAAMQAQQAQQQQPPEPQQQPLLAQEEVAALEEFRKEWPDVAKAVDIQTKVLAHNVIDYVFKEFAKEITPRLQQLEDLAERTHFEDIYNSVDDYDDIRDKVVDWVRQQPDYLRNAYGYVVEQGTPDQVADLINRWRFETGQQQPQQQRAPAPPPQQVVRQPSAAVRQAAAALAPVASKRSTVARVDDPNDFDGAWAQAVNSHRQ